MSFCSILVMPIPCHSQRRRRDSCEPDLALLVFENLKVVSYVSIERFKNILAERNPCVSCDLRRLKYLQDFPREVIGYCEPDLALLVSENLKVVSYVSIERFKNILAERNPCVSCDLRRLKYLQDFPREVIGYLG